MEYTIEITPDFESWLQRQKDRAVRYRLEARLDRVLEGHFGDHKYLAPNLFELRCYFGGGIRIYYTIRSGVVILLLCAGNKSSQNRDIKRAKALLFALEES